MYWICTQPMRLNDMIHLLSNIICHRFSFSLSWATIACRSLSFAHSLIAISMQTNLHSLYIWFDVVHYILFLYNVHNFILFFTENVVQFFYVTFSRCIKGQVRVLICAVLLRILVVQIICYFLINGAKLMAWWQ